MTKKELETLKKWRKKGYTNIDIQKCSLAECEAEYQKIFKTIQHFTQL